VFDEYGVAISTAGWMSTAQLAGFVLASWIGGRFLRPVRSVLVVGTLIGVVANLALGFAGCDPLGPLDRSPLSGRHLVHA